MGRLFAVLLALLAAVVLHVGFILFGGLIIGHENKDEEKVQQVELLSDEPVTAEKPKEPEKEPAEAKEQLETETEQAPDAAEMLRNLELSPAAQAPALEVASLSAIEDALHGQGNLGGDFSEALSFASGGRIGGTGKAGGLDEQIENAFSLGEIDQKPRPVFQSSPLPPSEMRGKKVEGVVTVIFVVDATGKVTEPRVEKSSNPAYDKPALQAIKQWKFEPAVRGGKRVPCKARQTFRFPAS